MSVKPVSGVLAILQSSPARPPAAPAASIGRAEKAAAEEIRNFMFVKMVHGTLGIRKVAR